MSALVNDGAICRCSFGSAPCKLNVPPDNKTPAGGVPAATIMNAQPSNLPTFGMCSSMSNPEVASATSAALGVLTPQMCRPVISAPWSPGSETVMINNVPALTDNSKALCNWLGVIEIISPGQQVVQAT